MRIVAPLVVLIGLALAPAAGAATVAVDETPCRSSLCSAVLRFVAADGEANDVAISSDGEAVLIRDSGAPLVSGRSCVAVDAGTSRCRFDASLERLRYVDVDVGNGDDVVNSTASLVASLKGGPGDDQLVGGPLDDFLGGGGGRDVLRGGPGSDMLRDGDGDAGLLATDPRPPLDADLLDGGGGRDLVRYDTRFEPLEVDLADPAPDGAAGEGDALVGIESVWAGDGADRLAGDAAANTLEDGEGEDLVDGRAGNDMIHSGGGADRLVGGPGDDLIRAGDGGVDRLIACGPGFDTVVSDPGDVLEGDCNRVVFPPELAVELVSGAVDGSGRAVRLRVLCGPTDAPLISCRGKLALLRRARALGSVSFALRAGRSKLLTVKLAAGDARRLRRVTGLAVTVHLAGALATSLGPQRFDDRPQRFDDRFAIRLSPTAGG